MATDAVHSGESESSTESTAGTGKRIAFAVLGGALLTAGLRRRSLGGVVAALAGGWLVYRGVKGGGRSRDAQPSGATDRERGAAEESGDVIEQSITVQKSADELYDLWRDPEQLNRVAGDAVEVTDMGEDRQRWTVEGPLGRRVEWEIRTVEDRPGELLRWESVESSRIASEGEVRFRPAPADRGTVVTLRFRFDPPGGRVGDAATSLLGVVPKTMASTTLDRFKSLAETGEIPTLDRNPSGRGQGDLM